MDSKNRVLYLDMLRIAATFATIIIHVSEEKYASTIGDFKTWNIFNIYDSLSRFSVPIFVMISGAIFLDDSKSISIQRIYSKNIKRMIIFFWSGFYTIYVGIAIFIEQGKIDKGYLVSKFIIGHYHMWFLPMIVGLYMIVPVWKKILEDKRLENYCMILSGIFVFIVPTVLSVIKNSAISTLYDFLYYKMTIGYISYFILGYYLYHNNLKGIIEIIIYGLGLTGILSTILISTYLVQYKGATYGYYDNFNINILLSCIGIFLFFKNIVSKVHIGQNCEKMIIKVSNCCFGIYMLHAFFIEILSRIGLNTLSFSPIISVMAIGGIVFLLSLGASYILHEIPLLRDYVV